MYHDLEQTVIRSVVILKLLYNFITTIFRCQNHESDRSIQSRFLTSVKDPNEDVN